MKTAMQELIEWLNGEIYTEKDSLTQMKITAYRMKAQLLLEKEKEQIMKAVEDTRSNIVPRMFINENLNGEEYYNQTYNQKQHIIDIMKADEDDGLYNPNK